jgi:hypothetical protein
MTNYAKGDIVEYNAFGHLRHVHVETRRKNIKNGEPGFQGEIIWDVVETWTPGDQAWGYDRDITRVNPTERPITVMDLAHGPFTPGGQR